MDKWILHRAYKLAYDKHTPDQYKAVAKWFDLALKRVFDRAAYDELERLASVVANNINNTFTKA